MSFIIFSISNSTNIRDRNFQIFIKSESSELVLAQKNTPPKTRVFVFRSSFALRKLNRHLMKILPYRPKYFFRRVYINRVVRVTERWKHCIFEANIQIALANIHSTIDSLCLLNSERYSLQNTIISPLKYFTF